jgi:hypothetical protein
MSRAISEQLIEGMTSGSSFAAVDQASDSTHPGPILPSDVSRLKRTAFWRRVWGPIIKSSLITAGILIAAFNNTIVEWLHRGVEIGVTMSPAASLAFFMGIAVLFFAIVRIAFWLYWTYWLDIRAKSNDSYVKVQALLSVVETYASFQNYATRCIFVAVLGYLFLLKFIAVGGQDEIFLFLSFVFSTALVFIAVNFQTSSLGSILIENLLFIAVQAEAAPIANENVYEDMSTRLVPKFRRERPEHFF